MVVYAWPNFLTLNAEVLWNFQKHQTHNFCFGFGKGVFEDSSFEGSGLIPIVTFSDKLSWRSKAREVVTLVLVPNKLSWSSEASALMGNLFQIMSTQQHWLLPHPLETHYHHSVVDEWMNHNNKVPKKRYCQKEWHPLLSNNHTCWAEC